MAESFSHKWGQIIGDLIEATILELLQKVAGEHKLYLDYKKLRKARPGKKVSWKDHYGNMHDLDYVLERGGSETTIEIPAAFIEIAWRRYTKHSRNKAQEIEGAIVPLADTYHHFHPFLGIILAGVFTKGSLEQLRSRGFHLVYFPYESVLKAFALVGIDASFHERTPEGKFRNKVARWNGVSQRDRARIKTKLLQTEKSQIARFSQELRKAISRRVLGITVSVLHGLSKEIATVKQAIEYIQTYDDSNKGLPILKYEINVCYSNGDTIHAIFESKLEAVKFLQSFA